MLLREDLKPFEKFMNGKGYKSLEVSSNPYEVLRLFRKAGVSKDFVIVFQKNNGNLSVSKKDEVWVKEFNIRFHKGEEEGRQENPDKPVRRHYMTAVDKAMMTDNYILEIERCGSKEELNEILLEIKDLDVLREIIKNYVKK